MPNDLSKLKRRLAGLTWQAGKLPDLYQRYGGQRLLSEAYHRLTRSRVRPAGAPPLLNEPTARSVLKLVMHKLSLEGDPASLLEGVRDTFGARAWQRNLHDLYALQRYLTQTEPRPGLAVRQASELPEGPPRQRRILFVSAHFPGPRHGGGSRVLNFLKPLSRTNEIYLAASYIRGEDDEALEGVKPYCRSVLQIPFTEWGGNQAAIREWLGRQSMDIVHYEWPRSLENYDPGYGDCQIFTYMEAVSLRLLMDLQAGERGTVRWLADFSALISSLRVELEEASALDMRIAVTSRDAEFFQRLNQHQEVMVLNHGLNFEQFSLPEVPCEPLTLVFSANFAHYPNVDAMRWFFGQVWPGIRREVPGARLMMVGHRPPRELSRLADGENVIVTGGVPDVRPYIQKAAVCIAPLVSGAGLRGKVIEYAAMRRAFVATPIAMEDMVFREGSEYLLAARPEEFASAVVSLLKDPQRARSMGAAAYETARENYDTARLVGHLERIYAYLEARSRPKGPALG